MVKREKLLEGLAKCALDIARKQLGNVQDGDAPLETQMEVAHRVVNEGEVQFLKELNDCNRKVKHVILGEEVIEQLREWCKSSRKREGPIDPEDPLVHRGESAEHGHPQDLEQLAGPAKPELTVQQRREALVERLRMNREGLAQELRGYLPLVEGLSFATVEESRAFVSELNLMLENAGQRLVEPESGQPATLFVTNPGRGPSGGYFSFKYTDPESGVQRSKGSYRKLPPLRLAEA